MPDDNDKNASPHLLLPSCTRYLTLLSLLEFVVLQEHSHSRIQGVRVCPTGLSALYTTCVYCTIDKTKLKHSPSTPDEI